MENLQQLIRQRKVEQEEKYMAESKTRLERIILTKLKTSFIGAISAVENRMGHLWGIDRETFELTDNQKKWNAVWEELRKTILNNGNNQIRAIQNELCQYSVKWNRYKYDLNVQEMNGRNNDESL